MDHGGLWQRIVPPKQNVISQLFRILCYLFPYTEKKGIQNKKYVNFTDFQLYIIVILTI